MTAPPTVPASFPAVLDRRVEALEEIVEPRLTRQAPGDDRRAAAGPARAGRRVDGSARAGHRDRRVAVPGAAFFDPLA